MVSRNVTPTRHTLAATRDRLKTAYRGKEILRRRRDRLVFLMSAILERYRVAYAALDAAFDEAVAVRNQALELEGGIALKAAAEACDTPPELLFLEDNLEGLPVPMILRRGVHKRLNERGYGILGTSAAIDETARTHEVVVDHLVSIAEFQLALSVLLAEIRRTTIRVNALEHRLIPELEATCDYIEFYLAEREREERIRQRFFKRRFGRGIRGRAAATVPTEPGDSKSGESDATFTGGDDDPASEPRPESADGHLDESTSPSE